MLENDMEPGKGEVMVRWNIVEGRIGRLGLGRRNPGR